MLRVLVCVVLCLCVLFVNYRVVLYGLFVFVCLCVFDCLFFENVLGCCVRELLCDVV